MNVSADCFRQNFPAAGDPWVLPRNLPRFDEALRENLALAQELLRQVDSNNSIFLRHRPGQSVCWRRRYPQLVLAKLQYLAV